MEGRIWAVGKGLWVRLEGLSSTPLPPPRPRSPEGQQCRVLLPMGFMGRMSARRPLRALKYTTANDGFKIWSRRSMPDFISTQGSPQGIGNFEIYQRALSSTKEYGSIEFEIR